MEKNNSYLERLDDERWYAKRAEILERNKCCVICESVNDLQVHHTIYHSGRQPWEYDNHELITLCQNCHLDTELLVEKIKWLIASIQQQRGPWKLDNVRVALERMLPVETIDEYRKIKFKHG